MVVSGGGDRTARTAPGARAVGGRTLVLLLVWRLTVLGRRHVQLAELATTLRPVQLHAHTPRVPAFLAGRARIQKALVTLATYPRSDSRSSVGSDRKH